MLIFNLVIIGWRFVPIFMVLLAVPLFIIFLMVKKWLRKDFHMRRQMEHLQKELDQFKN